eukprot:TRINITY_DN1350_c2_g1_i1.p1 TRINITY_DN1350_c2_g1~~TRINITY_DN1350_c2_g1_i1.p1  ORF type:complete len:283 (+),score=52.29 TRINITY_DN1350_c2_g1_i1:68-850(+)
MARGSATSGKGKGKGQRSKGGKSSAREGTRSKTERYNGPSLAYPCWLNLMPWSAWEGQQTPWFDTAGSSYGSKERSETMDLVLGALTDGKLPSTTSKQVEINPQDFIGQWIDSRGNEVSVICTDAFSDCKNPQLQARLMKRNRKEIILSLRPLAGDEDAHPAFDSPSGWQCGNSVLDLFLSTPEQLIWVAADGSTTCWVPDPKASSFDPLEIASSGVPSMPLGLALRVCGGETVLKDDCVHVKSSLEGFLFDPLGVLSLN